jgi:hypothetical protein
MSKDDYHVIAYRLLTYLYACLKKSVPADGAVLTAAYFEIGAPYWEYILKNLSQEGNVTGVLVIPTLTGGDAVKIQPNIAITPKGIEYLSENPLFQKIKEAARDIAAIIPV